MSGVDYFAIATTNARAAVRRIRHEREAEMSRYDYPDPGDDPNYCNGLGGHPGIVMHCVDCGVEVYVSRDEPYPGPALRCANCAAIPLPDRHRQDRKAVR